jgi:hypothetical protein
MNIGYHVNCLLLSGFSKNWNMLTSSSSVVPQPVSDLDHLYYAPPSAPSLQALLLVS